MPVLAYHWPKVSAPGITIEELKAVKVAGAQGLHRATASACSRSWPTSTSPIYTGSAAIVAFAGQLGCAGAILAAANLEPELCVDAFAGNIQAQKDLLWAHKLISTAA